MPELAQVLHGRLLTGRGEHFLRQEPGAADASGGEVSEEPLAWAPAKVSGRYLSPYLIAKNVVDSPPARRGPPAPGIDVFVALTRRQKRMREDMLGLSPLGVIGGR